MIIDSVMKESPPAVAAEKGGCRRRSELPEVGDAAAKRSRNFRRRRLELRRQKSGGDRLIESDRDGRSEGENEEKIRSRFGAMEHLGRRREMEDAAAAELGFLERGGGGGGGARSYSFYGVYDGPGGRRVARECSERLHELVAARAAAEDEEGAGWEGVMKAAFREMDEEVNRNGGAEVATMGTTAVVAVVGEEEVVVANCGDSRAVVCRGGVAVQLSDDHKPDRPDELERIEASGGKVINWNGPRVLGVLSTSRSIGDQYLKPYVIAEPEVKIINRTSADEFLILASDGLWDVISNEFACRVTRRCLDGRLKRKFLFSGGNGDTEGSRDQFGETNNENRFEEAAVVLVELAMARGSRDNVSVIVVDLSYKHRVS